MYKHYHPPYTTNLSKKKLSEENEEDPTDRTQLPQQPNLSQMRLLHKDKLFDETHVVGFALAKDGAHPGYFLRFVVVIIQIATIVVSLGLLQSCTKRK